jgi:acetylornithine deacetylase/succinyl-diaminopimelate desuccinylase-like protein
MPVHKARRTATLASALARLCSLTLLLSASTLSAATVVNEAVDKHLAAHAVEMLTDFRSLLSLPNVSTSTSDMQKNAEWISDYIGRRGFSSKIVSAGGAPYIIAQRPTPGASKTVLIYAHYDGQPVEPANWKTPPFEPTLKSAGQPLEWSALAEGDINPDWRVYARSAGDDKAPVVALMHAIDALQGAGLSSSVNVKLILDGEEEFGSPTVAQILAQHGDELSADVLLFCDGPMHQSGRRQLVFGVRGDMGVHLTAYGPARPLHSGHYGNWAPHPTDALMRLLATLKDMDGKILVPGYLDEVTPMSEAERVAIAAMPAVDDQLRDELALGRIEGSGERLETLIMQPAINIVGFQAGGVGRQARNIILPTATASLDLRLVKGQTIETVRSTLEAHFRNQGFYVTHEDPDEETRKAHPGVLKVDWEGGYPAYRSALDGPEAQKLAGILRAYDGEAPLMTPTMGGSLPIYLFEQALDMPIVLLPIANHDNNQHGRDENMRIGNLFSAVGVYAAVLHEFGRD